MNLLFKVLIASLFIVFCFVLVGQISAATDTACLKALIVTGQSNPWHKWENSAPILKQLLEQTGLFEVDIAVSPPDSNGIEYFKPSFADYSVVVLDYDNYNRPGWSEQTKSAFVEYVASGGGVVVYHASDNSFPDWKQYNEITGLGGWGGRDEKAGPIVTWRGGKLTFINSPGAAGSHAPAHPFQVANRNSTHPITKDLPEKWMHAEDELYGKLRGPAQNLTVLATAYSELLGGGSGEHEIVLFTVNYGKGRIFHTTLGHVKELPAPAVECVGFIVTFRRGAEWAATGNVTQKVPDDFPTPAEVRTRRISVQPSPSFAELQLQQVDELLAKIIAYDFGQSRADLIKLEGIVRQSQDSPRLLEQIENHFLKFLRSDATLAGKQFICRQLSIIGTEQSVPTLAEMLTNPDTSDMARYALQRIPVSAVDDALRNALAKTAGKIKVGIINSLGDRRDKAAVMPLSKLLSGTDKEIAQAAAASLGKIADPNAAAELGSALKQASADMHPALADAYLTCAYNLAASGNQKAAADIYRQFLTSAELALIRSAALKGLVDASPQDAVKLVVDVLKGGDPALQPTAIWLVRKLLGTEATQTIAAELLNLSPAGQVQLLSALADRGDPAAAPAVVAAAKAHDQQVRIAALKALSPLGDSSTAILLAQAAAVADGDERQAARDSLYSLNSPGVNQAIVEQIAKADPDVKVELIRSIGQRNVCDAVQTVLQTANDPDADVRLESIKVLKDLAQPQHLPKLVDVLVNAPSDAELEEAGKMVSFVARKSTAENPSAPVLNVLDSVKAVNVRCALLKTLGGIGDANSLGVLRTSLVDTNTEIQTAAVRALSDWPNAAPAADLLEIAKSSSSRTNHVLALRGYVRLVGLDANRPAEETVKMCSKIMQSAANPDEKKLVLSALSNVRGIDSLNMTASYLDDPNLQQEAAAAVVKIAESTIKTSPNETKVALQKVLGAAATDPLCEKAQQLLNQINPP
jgi:HEAT repeat protein/type 1 glutamine amidotransferase